MGAKPLAATQRQIAAILRGAKAAGVNLEIIAENGRIRFRPSDDGKPGERSEVDMRDEGYL